MKTILLTIVIWMIPFVGSSQSKTFDFNEMLGFTKIGVEKTTQFLTQRGWAVTSEGEETEPLPLEYRIFNHGANVIKISCTRHLENVLESLLYVDVDMDIAFNMQARAWIRQKDLILKDKDRKASIIAAGAFIITEHYSKVIGIGMVFLDMGTYYLAYHAKAGYRYQITDMGAL